MQYAVIETGGKQYKVNVGDSLSVESLGLEVGKNVSFEKVMLLVSDGKVEIGVPYLENVEVIGKVTDNKKGEKIRVAKFKAKSRYRRVMGHRQHLSQVLIEAIKQAPKAAVKKEVKISKKSK